MTRLWEEHKEGIIGVGAVVLFLVFYLSLKKRQSGGGASASPLALAASLAQQNQAANLQQAQLASQYGLQESAIQAQIAQTNGQVQAANNQTDAALALALAQNQTQDRANTLNAGVYSTQINATTAEQEAIAKMQEQLYMQAQQNQFLNNQKILAEVGKAGLNHGTPSLESSLTGIISGVENQPAIGVAAVNSGGYATAAQAAQQATLFNDIFGTANNVLSSIGL